MQPDTTELVLRVVAAAGLGAIIGLERELSNQTAGLRTHILVSLGACLFSMVGAFGFEPAQGVDPTRIAAQVVTGIGFLGAGAILRQGLNIRGLTTSAGLWVTAAVGMAVAFGFWVGALVTTGVTAVALFGLKRVERKLLRRLKPDRYEFGLTVTNDIRLSEIDEVVENAGCRIESVTDEVEDGQRRFTMTLRLPPRMTAQKAAEMLGDIEGVGSVDWSR